MHDLRLIHTDLKPENILLVSHDYSKVPDYNKVLTLFLCYLLCLLFDCIIWLDLLPFFSLTFYQFANCRTHLDHPKIAHILKEFQSQVLLRLLILEAQLMNVKNKTILYQRDITELQRLFLVSLNSICNDVFVLYTCK